MQQKPMKERLFLILEYTKNWVFTYKFSISFNLVRKNYCRENGIAAQESLWVKQVRL